MCKHFSSCPLVISLESGSTPRNLTISHLKNGSTLSTGAIHLQDANHPLCNSNLCLLDKRSIEVEYNFIFSNVTPFGQHLCWVLATIDLFQPQDSQMSITKKILNEMIPQLNVFGPKVECWILNDKKTQSDYYCT